MNRIKVEVLKNGSYEKIGSYSEPVERYGHILFMSDQKSGVDLRLVQRARLVAMEDQSLHDNNKDLYNHVRSLLPVYEQKSFTFVV